MSATKTFSENISQGISSALDLGCEEMVPTSLATAPFVSPSDGKCFFNIDSVSSCSARPNQPSAGTSYRRICPCACPENSFGTGSSVCTPCAPGSIAPAGSKFAIDCLCSPLDYTANVTGQCEACPLNSAIASFNTSDVFLGGSVLGWEGARSAQECGHFGSILGGYNQLGRSSFLRKTFPSLCRHNRVAIAFAFVAIDAWDGEAAMLFLDGVLVWDKTFSNQHVGDGGCGGAQGDALAVEGKLVVDHRERQMTVEFRTTLGRVGGPVDASWGLSFFVAGALCSGEDATACTASMPVPGNYGGLIDGELALVGDTGLVTTEFAINTQRALGVSLWLLENVAGIVDIETLQRWTLTGIDRLVLGEEGQNCNSVCASAGLSCSDTAFPYRVLNAPTVMPALARVLGIECDSSYSRVYDDLALFNPCIQTSYNYDSMGIVTSTTYHCYYGFREVYPGSSISAVIPTCSASNQYHERLCPCGIGGA